MSRRNGDKSRYNRLRKQAIDRRMRHRELFSAGSAQPKTAAGNKPKVPSAAPAATTTSEAR